MMANGGGAAGGRISTLPDAKAAVRRFLRVVTIPVG